MGIYDKVDNETPLVADPLLEGHPPLAPLAPLSQGLAQYDCQIKGRVNNHVYGRRRISRPMQIVAPIFLFPLASKKGLIAENLPIFRAPRKGEGRSAPAHGQGTLRPSPRKKKCMGRGQHTTNNKRMDIEIT